MFGYHEGEIAVQERVGVRDAAARLAGIVSDRVPERVSPFLETLGAVAVSATAPDGSPWASLWVGEPGLLGATSGGAQVLVRGADSPSSHDDPVRVHLRQGANIGMLAIDFATRRRVRVNGRVAKLSDDGVIVVDVDQVFVNCPKYIQRRVGRSSDASPNPGSTLRGDTLDAERRAFVMRADTAFIGSGHPTRGLDVSHRGGRPGFLQVLSDRALFLPDYSGNNMFTTFGNLAVSPLAAFTVVDFDARRLLSMTGRATLVHDREPAPGAERGCEFQIESWVELAMGGNSDWTLLDRSPFNPACATAFPEP